MTAGPEVFELRTYYFFEIKYNHYNIFAFYDSLVIYGHEKEQHTEIRLESSLQFAVYAVPVAELEQLLLRRYVWRHGRCSSSVSIDNFYSSWRSCRCVLGLHIFHRSSGDQCKGREGAVWLLSGAGNTVHVHQKTNKQINKRRNINDEWIESIIHPIYYSRKVFRRLDDYSTSWVRPDRAPFVPSIKRPPGLWSIILIVLEQNRKLVNWSWR